MSNTPIHDRIYNAQLAIDNTLESDEILQAVTPFGFGETRLGALTALVDEVVRLNEKKAMDYGEQYAASQSFNAAWAAAQDVYISALKIGRIAFRGNAKAQTSLILRGKRARKFGVWYEQAHAFYANLLDSPDLLARMAEFGYDAAKLNEELALVQVAWQVGQAQERRKGEARETTQQRNVKLAELDRAMADFKTIAFIALAEDLQQLEKLGFGPV